MGVSGGAFATWVGSFFTGAGAAATGATAADAAATGAAAGGAAAAGTAGSAAVAAGTTVATEAGGAGLVAGTGAGAGVSAAGGITASGVSAAAAAASGASALYQLSQGGRGVNVPPSPQGPAHDDQSQIDTQQQALRRAQAAGGLQSTTGTPGGQAGAMLNPSTLSSKTLLGG